MSALGGLAPAFALTVALLASGATTAQVAGGPEEARGYPLGAGDVLSISFLNNPELSFDVPVEFTGYASFPLAGPVLVAGRTIDELRAELPVVLTGVKLRESAGNATHWRSVEDEEILVSVKHYRPIVVSGDVRRPGEVPFTVGMTVREAVSKSLGVGSLSRPDGPSTIVDDFKNRANLGNAMVERAVQRALLDGRAAIAAEDIAVPTGANLPRDRLVQRASARLDAAIDLLEEQQEQRDRQVLAAREAVMDALVRAEELAREQVVESENVARLERLLTRSLAYSGSLVQAKRNDLKAAEIARSARDAVDEARFAWSALQGTHRIETLSLRQEWLDRLGELDGEIDVLSAALSEGSVQAATITLYRKLRDQTRQGAVSMDDHLMPGDLIEVEISLVGQ
ncbi:polysaccharide biosynthesis/export family protein [Aliiruegeria haliotis]|nr:polysaccharide biosynthesis/export family protein [Aliiruegeria haliotis]